MKRLVAASLLCFTGGVVTLGAVEERDALVAAAQKALVSGQPVAALQVLDGHPQAGRPGRVRLIEAQALLALGRHQEAAGRLAFTTGSADGWPDHLRAAAESLAGEIALAGGDLVQARQHLERALRRRGEGVAADRVLLLLAECCERQGDTPDAVRYAHAVWRDWPRSPYRGRAGIIEARLIAAQQPDQARSVLAGVRVLDQAEPATRLAAAELLCHLLLPTRPGQCLVVAEQDLRRLPLPGRLPLYRALALAALDARDGLAALLALSEPLRGDPAATATIARLQALPAVQAEDAGLRVERARAEIELGRVPTARALLEPLAMDHPAALILLATIDEVPLERWASAPAMGDPAARAALGMAFSRRGDHQRAWPLLHPLVMPTVQRPDGVTADALLYWAVRSAQQQAPAQVAALSGALLALDSHTLETGLAWADEAQRRERSGAPAEPVRVAWERAGTDLPAEHPWQPIAILRAARPLIGQEGGLERAVRLLERVPDATGEDRQRCRFLLAQVYERLSRISEALRVVDELHIQATGEQAEKLARMRARLASSGTSEVQGRPLDAEN